MFLSLDRISKAFAGFTAVKNFSVDIQQGELVSILGPSGCGKTTVLRVISGLLAPSRGRIILEGEDITGIPPEKRPVSTVFQSYALFPHMTVMQNVVYGLKGRKTYSGKETEQKGLEMLATVGLEEQKNNNVTQLSGGQQQRVALARALILNPKVLLMDEPLSNLDAKLRIKMRKEIKQIQKKFGITMIFVTHDQEEAMSISDRIVIMNEGAIEQNDVPKQIYDAPRNEFVADFIGRANILNLHGGKAVIRPQCVMLSRHSGQHKGRIMEKNFLGFYTCYVIEGVIAGEQHLIQVDIVESIERSAEYEPGQDIFFSFEKVHYLGA